MKSRGMGVDICGVTAFPVRVGSSKSLGRVEARRKLVTHPTIWGYVIGNIQEILFSKKWIDGLLQC